MRLHCFDFSRRWPKHIREEEVRRILRSDVPGEVQLIARRIARRAKVQQMGYLMTLELLWRVGAALEEVMGEEG